MGNAMAIAFLYVLPAFIAALRRHHNAGAITMMNILLGWTVLGWIAALIWSVTAVKKIGMDG